MRGDLGRLVAGEPSRGRHGVHATLTSQGSKPQIRSWSPVQKEHSSRLLVADVDHFEAPRQMTHLHPSTTCNLD